MAFTLESQTPTNRVHRRPKHKFYLSARPYQIVPVAIAPVLPAETISSTWFEARVVTDPIKNPLIGWKQEYYGFYVKIRDLPDRDTLDDLFINPTASVSALNTAASVPYYHAGNSPNYTQMCLRRVVETWFRDEGEAWNNADIGNYPSAQVRDQGWMDSLVDTTVLPAGSGDPGATTTPEALEAMMDAYEQLRAMNFTSMSFEDYAQTFGVKLSREAMHEPERLFSFSAFQYPSNTVEPTTGVPASAVSWVFKETERHKKFFKEPGFIFVVAIVRPKVYFEKAVGSLSHYLDKGLSWLPAVMRDSPETSLREFVGGAGGTGPLGVNATNGYWLDMRDLFLYGDQLVNVALTATDMHAVGLPTAALVRKYLTAADVDEMFKTASPSNTIRSDGFCSFDILGSQIDYTGGHQAMI
jgi:hypothetical protein